MSNFVQRFGLIFKIFLLSFINLDEKGYEISFFLLVFNSLKLSILSIYNLFTVGNVLTEGLKAKNFQDIQWCGQFLMEIIFLIITWIYMLMKRKSFIRLLKLAERLIIEMNLPVEFDEIYSKAKKKCSLVFVAFHFHILFTMIFSLSVFAYLYSRNLVYNFKVWFYFATEFVLTCLKVLNEKLARVIASQGNVLMSGRASKSEITKACKELSKTIELLTSAHTEIHSLSTIVCQIFNVTILLSLLFQLFSVIIGVK